MNEKELIPLIDGDIVRIRCGFAADGQMKKEAKEAEPDASDERIAEMLADLDYIAPCLQNVKTVMEVLTEKFSPEYRLFVHGKDNFRYQLATIKPYKGHRDKAHRPKYLKEITEYLKDHWNAEFVFGQESDDVLGIVQSAASPDTTVICSNDKDMQMVPGFHYDWTKDSLIHVSQEEADLMLFWQMVVGDTSDNIPGIMGLGPKRTAKIIQDCNGLDQVREAVKDLYRKQYGDMWGAAYEEVGNLLWIRREEEQRCPLL